VGRGPGYGKPHVGPRLRVNDPDKFTEDLQAAGFTIRSLAKHLDCKKSTFYDIAKGRSGVAPAFARRVEEALDVPVGTRFVSVSPDGAATDSGRQQEAKHDESDGTASQPTGNQQN
jgi:transcriptional regulator with XRE-family HTH domain